MKKVIVLLIVVSILLASCAYGNSGTEAINTDKEAQDAGVLEIVKNQPLPNLGGYSLVRDTVSRALLEKNKSFKTYSYMKDMNGKITKICNSIGYPVPYGTQMTNPERADWSGVSGVYVVLPNPEPDSMYYPENVAATWVTCVMPNGSTNIQYFEPEVFALTWQIKVDYDISPIE